jgi:nitrate reductase beta subunit
MVRKDNRHNLSLYFYHLYLRFEVPSFTSSLAFLPQVWYGPRLSPYHSHLHDDGIGNFNDSVIIGILEGFTILFLYAKLALCRI